MVWHMEAGQRKGEVEEKMDETLALFLELRAKANTSLTDNRAAARHLGIN